MNKREMRRTLLRMAKERNGTIVWQKCSEGISIGGELFPASPEEKAMWLGAINDLWVERLLDGAMLGSGRLTGRGWAEANHPILVPLMNWAGRSSGRAFMVLLAVLAAVLGAILPRIYDMVVMTWKSGL